MKRGKGKKNMMKRGKGEKMKEEHVWKAKKGMRKMKCEGGGGLVYKFPNMY